MLSGIVTAIMIVLKVKHIIVAAKPNNNINV